MQYFIIKTTLGIILGIFLCVIFAHLAKRDHVPTLSNPSKKSKIIRLCVFSTISLCCFAMCISLICSGSLNEYEFDLSYRQHHLLEDYYGKYDYSNFNHREKSEKYIRWYNYNKPRLDHLSYEQGNTLFENHMYIERFGEDAFSENNDKGKRDLQYRDAILKDRIQEIFGDDERYSEITQMTLRGQLELLFSDYMTEREIRLYIVGCEKVNNTRLMFDAVLLLGFIFLSLGLYCFYFKSSDISKTKKFIKILAYAMLLSAYFNCTDYHPDFVPTRAAVSYSLFVLLILISYLLIRLTKSKN